AKVNWHEQAQQRRLILLQKIQALQFLEERLLFLFLMNHSRFFCLKIKLIFPIKSSSFHFVQKPYNHNKQEYSHFPQSVSTHFFEIHCPRVHKNHLNIKQYEKNRNQEILHAKRRSCISDGFDSAFEVFVFVFRRSFRS